MQQILISWIHIILSTCESSPEQIPLLLEIFTDVSVYDRRIKGGKKAIFLEKIGGEKIYKKGKFMP